MRSISGSAAIGAFIIRYFLRRPAMTEASIVSTSCDLAGAPLLGVGGADQDGLAVDEPADAAEAVHHQCRPGGHEVDDAVREAHPGRDLDGAADRHHLHRDAALAEEPAGGVRVGGGEAEVAQVLDRPGLRVVRDGGFEPAAAVAELGEDRQLGAGLQQQVRAGDAQVRDAVADELDDVLGPDEQDVQREVLDVADERSGVVLEHQAGVTEEVQRGLDEATLVGHREAETRGVHGQCSSAAVGYGRSLPPAARWSASRYPPVPWLSHWAMRVTVAVLAPVSRAISW